MYAPFEIRIQLSELNDKGEYAVTATARLPNRTFTAKDIRMLSGAERVLGNDNDVELVLNISGAPLRTMADTHTLFATWHDPCMPFGQEWKRMICHIVLDGKWTVGTLLYQNEEMSLVDSFVNNRKQRLTDIASVVAGMTAAGSDPTVLIHKEKGNGC